MSPDDGRILLTFSEVLARWRAHPLRQSEIPIEHEVSLPIPTKRWGEPAYVFFAAPGVREKGRRSQTGAPDRWWAIAAHGGRVLAYALLDVVPLVDVPRSEREAAAGSPATVAEHRQRLSTIEALMDTLALAFFEGRQPDEALKGTLATTLAAHVGAERLDGYRAFAPDFMAWLGD